MEKDFSFLNYLKTVTSDEKVYEGLDPSELWLFRLSESDIRGPFRQDDIVKLISRFRHEFAPLDVCTVGEKVWKPFFDHTCFNLRELSKNLNPQAKFRKIELVADDYLCMVNGIKRGPFSQSEIKEMIATKELKPDALISADHGMTWHRAYSFPQFDRRSRETIKDHAFLMPDDAIEKTKIIVLEKIKKSGESADAVSAGVALLSGKNRHLRQLRLQTPKTEKIQQDSYFSKFFSSENKGKNKKSNPLFVVVLSIALIILILAPNEPKQKAKQDVLEVLQRKGQSTIEKYEENTPPKPIKYVQESEKYRPKRPASKDQSDYGDSEENMDQENSDQYDAEQDSGREISSQKKKAVKKINITHKDPNEVDEEAEDDSEDSIENTQDFELTE